MVYNVLYILMFLMAYQYFYIPWREFRDVRREKQSAAAVYIKEHCKNKAEIRLMIGDLDMCKTAEKRVASSPRFDAWEDLLQSWGIFPKTGLWGSLNVFETVGYAAGGIAVMWFAGVAISVYASLRVALKNLNAESTLPGLDYKKRF